MTRNSIRHMPRRVNLLFFSIDALLFLSVLFSCECWAQEVQSDANKSTKEPLTMQRIFASGEFSERGNSSIWAPVGDSFVRRIQSKDVPNGQDVVFETPDGSQTTIVGASELIPRNSDNGVPVSIDSYSISEDSNLVLIYSKSKRIWRRNTRGDYWILDRKNDVFRKLGGDFATPSSLQFAKFSPDGSRVAYVFKNNLYAEEIVSGKIVQLTFDGDRDVINGTFDWVYEEEFDCRDGFRWSPDGKKIAFWRLDSSKEPEFVMLDDVGLSTVTGASRIDVAQVNGDFQSSFEKSNDSEQVVQNVNETEQERLKSYPTLVAFKYPRVGCANADVAIGIVTLPELGVDSFDVNSNTKFVDFDDPNEYYLPSMEWYKGPGGLVVQKTPRSQRECSVYSVDPETAQPSFMFSEADPDGAWQTVYPIYPLKDGDRFLRVSERDGWRRYYLTSFSDIERTTPITLADADAIDFVAFDFDAEGNEIGVYYYASPENGTQKFLYRASFDGVNERVVISESTVSNEDGATSNDEHWGFETWSVSSNSNWAICRRSAFGKPTRIDLAQLNGANATLVKCLEDNAILRKKLNDEQFGASEFFKVEIDARFDFEQSKSEDVSNEKATVSLDGWIMFPRDWDPNDSKKYPVLVYVYGEPASQTVVDSWGGSTYLYHRAIAEQGCVVLSVDGRGTPAPKGRVWRKSVYQKFGAVGRNDQAAALRRILNSFPYSNKLDKSRVGVWGWSGGGTSTLNLLFNYPDLYTCGIAIAPVPDYRNYDTIYQERYSGLITETPESYELGSPIGYASKLEGKLLLIHGSGDDNCHYQTSERLINALIASGKEFDAFNYPFRSHGIFEGAGTTLHLRNKTMKFWHENLLNSTADENK